MAIDGDRTRWSHDRPRFFPPALSAKIVRALDVLLQRCDDVTEAYLVSVRTSRGDAATPTLVVVSEDPAIPTRLEREMLAVLTDPERPAILALSPYDATLEEIRAVGGELKRGKTGFPWLLFMGI